MVHKGDLKIVSHMLRNLEKESGKVEFQAPLVVTAPTYNIIDELKEEGDWNMLEKYSGFVFNDDAPKNTARTEYENMMYLERPGCNLCMGNQEKAERGDTVMSTSTRLFQGRVVEDSDRKKGESPRIHSRCGIIRHPWTDPDHGRIRDCSRRNQPYQVCSAARSDEQLRFFQKQIT